MPIGPTAKMKRLQARWLTSTIRIWTETASIDVDPATGQKTTVESDVWTGAGTVHSDIVARIPGEGRVFGQRVLDIKLDADTDATPATGMRFRIVACEDATLTGAEGSVVEVVRAVNQVARRFTVQMENSR